MSHAAQQPDGRQTSCDSIFTLLGKGLFWLLAVQLAFGGFLASVPVLVAGIFSSDSFLGLVWANLGSVTLFSVPGVLAASAIVLMIAGHPIRIVIGALVSVWAAFGFWVLADVIMTGEATSDALWFLIVSLGFASADAAVLIRKTTRVSGKSCLPTD